MKSRITAGSNSSSGSNEPRVLLAIEHGLERAAYAHALGQQGDIMVVAAVSDSASVFEKLESQGADLLVVDAGLPPFGGASTLLSAVDRWPNLGMMLVSDHVIISSVLDLIASRQAGLGVVTKGMFKEVEDFVPSVQIVASGRILLEPNVARLLASGKDFRPLEILTEGECKVLAAVAEGLSNSAAAERLELSQRTIENHLSSILVKLGERGRSDHDGRVMAILRYLEADGRLSAA